MIQECARAKINLFLEITGKRPDGYHDLVTVMQTVSLADTLTFERSPVPGVRLTVSGNVPAGGDNLVCRAANAFFATTGAPFGVDVTLQKNIPVSAGLGGGSADAAATLRALNRLSKKKLSRESLLQLALFVGADVPFLVEGGLAVCRGVGERITPVSHTVPGVIVVAIGNEGVSTPAAFAALDRMYDNFNGFTPHPALRGWERLPGGALPHGAAFNRFEEAILPGCPEATSIRQTLRNLGATVAQMSGSGPSVFGIFDTENAAKAAVAELENNGARAFVCRAEPRTETEEGAVI